MSRIELEDTRRRQLIETTIETMADVGFVGTTLGQIAGRAGVSPGLVAHYFGDKDGLLEATLRHLARRVTAATRACLAKARSPRERVQAVIDANLAPEEFDRQTCTVWLAFWGQVIHSRRLKRIQTVYQQRMLSNLRHPLKELLPSQQAERLAIAIAAVIDGLWLRATLSESGEADSATARQIAGAFVDAELARAAAERVPVFGHVIAGRLRPASPRGTAVTEPATGRLLARLDAAGKPEIAEALAAARAAQAEWAAAGPGRAPALRKAAAGLRAEAEAMAALLAGESGLPLRFARAEVEAAAAALDQAACLAARPAPPLGGRRSLARGIVLLEPAGPRPFAVFARLAAAALAGGNGVIAVPQSARLAITSFAARLSDAGLPGGTIAVLHGGERLARSLARHEAVAPALPAAAGTTGILLTAEGDVAAATLATAHLLGSGNGVTLVVAARAAAELRRRLTDALAGLACGDPREARTEIGTLPDEAAAAAAAAAVVAAREAGAELVAGSGVPLGCRLSPCLLWGGAAEAASAGPVARVHVFTDDAGRRALLAGIALDDLGVFAADPLQGAALAAASGAASVWFEAPAAAPALEAEDLLPFTRRQAIACPRPIEA
ncbi:transcriptional regulator BetI [Zavarzinia sp.]|uniref:choline-binding transcriptional repressor BetI n=1 Tax=Zavarzinia sp. TaxID=2027920 RepID=UPI003564CF90